MTPELVTIAGTPEPAVDNTSVCDLDARLSMYALKAYMLPRLYWHGMLRGRA